VAGHRVAEVALLLNEIVLVGEHHQCVADRGVAVGVELHGVADDVGDLVELAVIHLRQGGEDPALNGFQAVASIKFWPIRGAILVIGFQAPLLPLTIAFRISDFGFRISLSPSPNSCGGWGTQNS